MFALLCQSIRTYQTRSQFGFIFHVLQGLLLIVATASFSVRTTQPSIFMAKTKETFKLADLLFLECQLQARPDYNVTRLVVDAATGSSLLQCDCSGGLQPFMKSWVETSSLPSCLRRCDWIALVESHAKSAPLLMERLQLNPVDVRPGWMLDYVRFEQGQGSQNHLVSPRPGIASPYNKITLLCAVSQTMPQPPTLEQQNGTDRFLLVDTGHSGPGIYLVRILSTSHEFNKSVVEMRWPSRPFQYSSAINIQVADIVLDILLHMVVEKCSISGGKQPHNFRLLDPTCGSGTFLAFAVTKGMHVEGCDCNLKCVEGSVRNLQHLFGKIVEDKCQVYCHDSTMPWPETSGEVDCVVANLPWGLNTIDYQNENAKILQSVRTRIRAGTPCAFVTKDSHLALYERVGFQVVGEACVPQRDFVLPSGKKKGHVEDCREAKDDRNGRNSCVITIALSK